MVSKPKKPAQSSESSKAANTPEPSTPARAPPTASTNAPGPVASGATGATAGAAEAATPTAPQSSAQPASFNDPSAFAVGSQRESAINNIVEMGYPRDQVEVAMRAAFNNPDRAVEYLLTGIPENVRPPQQQEGAEGAAEGQQAGEGEDIEIEHEGEDAEQGAGDNEEGAGEDVNLFDAAAAAAQGRGAGAQGGAGAGAGAGAGGADLSFLQHHPQFQQMRELIRQQPQMLEVIIQQLAAANPQLAQLIASNPEGFINLLRGPEDEEGGELPPGVTQIQVTPEENDAIERLVALGFSRDIVIQAYFACDKNEEVAANYLFEHGHDDDE